MKKLVELFCVIVMVISFLLTLGLVGSNEQGDLSDKDMIIGTLITNGVMLVAGYIAHKIEESDYLTEEEYEELLKKEAGKGGKDND